MAAIKIATLVSTPGFIQAFEAQLKTGKHKTKAAAYEALEAKRVKHFGVRKNASYDSFRVVRRLYLAKQTNQPQTTI